MFLLLWSIASNIVAVVLSIFAFKMQRYEYVVDLDYFLKNSGYDNKSKKSAANYDEDKLREFIEQSSEDLADSLIRSYISCNKLNAMVNDKKGLRVLWAQMIFLIGLLIIPVLVVIVLQAFLAGAVFMK